MDSEIDKQQRLVAASAAEFNRVVVDTFQVLQAQGINAETQGLIEQCYSKAEEYENNLNSLLDVMNREPVKYAEEIPRIYKHKVLRKQALDSLALRLKALSGSP